MIAEVLAVIRGHEDPRVVPLPEPFERLPDAAELVVDLAHHAEVLRAQLAHRVVAARRRGLRVAHQPLVQRVAALAAGAIGSGIAAGS